MAGFVIPYMAVYSPELMLQGYQGKELFSYILSVIYICAKVGFAILFWGMAVIGYLNGNLNIYERVLAVLIPSFLLLAIPLTDEIGFALIAVFFICRWINKRKLKGS